MTGRVPLEPHAHTKEVSSCGWLSARELIETLHAHGYGAVVITDHYQPGERNTRESRDAFLGGYHAAKAAGGPLGVTVLPGMEIRFKDKNEDYLVYGMEEADFPQLPDDACEMGLRAFHAIAKEKGWMIYQAHPFRQKQLPALPSDIDGMEVFNGNPRHNSQNRLAAKFAALHSLRTLAGSDIHQKGDAGSVQVLVPREALTPKAFAAWLQSTPHPRIQYEEMPVDGIRYRTEAVPNRAMLEALYLDAGWTSYTESIATTLKGVRESLRIVTAWDDTALVGMARAVGDGHTILYIQDILVLGAYQRRGIGRALLHRLLLPYKDVRQTVLITDDEADVRAFYKACGFENIAQYGCAGYIRLK